MAAKSQSEERDREHATDSLANVPTDKHHDENDGGANESSPGKRHRQRDGNKHDAQPPPSPLSYWCLLRVVHCDRKDASENEPELDRTSRRRLHPSQPVAAGDRLGDIGRGESRKASVKALEGGGPSDELHDSEGGKDAHPVHQSTAEDVEPLAGIDAVRHEEGDASEAEHLEQSPIGTRNLNAGNLPAER